MEYPVQNHSVLSIYILLPFNAGISSRCQCRLLVYARPHRSTILLLFLGIGYNHKLLLTDLYNSPLRRLVFLPPNHISTFRVIFLILRRFSARESGPKLFYHQTIL